MKKIMVNPDFLGPEALLALSAIVETIRRASDDGVLIRKLSVVCSPKDPRLLTFSGQAGQPGVESSAVFTGAFHFKKTDNQVCLSGSLKLGSWVLIVESAWDPGAIRIWETGLQDRDKTKELLPKEKRV